MVTLDMLVPAFVLFALRTVVLGRSLTVRDGGIDVEECSPLGCRKPGMI